MFKRVLFTTLTLTAVGANASDYQFELSGDVGLQDVDESLDSETYSLEGIYYFNPVQTRTHPLGQAAFLERASNIRIGYNRETLEGPDQTFTNGEDQWFVQEGTSSSVDAVSVRGEWYLPGDLFYMGLGLTHFEEDFFGSRSDTRWSASLGITPAEGLLISTDIYEGRDGSEHWNLGAKYVTDDLGPTLAFEARYHSPPGDDYMSLSVDYYIDRTFSIGIARNQRGILDDTDPDYSLIRARSGYIGGSTWDNTEVRAQKFIGDRWSLSGRVYTDSWGDGFGFGASVRF